MPPLLVLFDIDGTLLRPCGLGRLSLDRAFAERFGRADAFEGIRFHGRTDPGIFAEGLARVGVSMEAYPEALAGYLGHLRDEVQRSSDLSLPGVRGLLDLLSAKEDVTLGLVTGNVREGARIKLEKDGLWSRFVLGAFGDDSAHRPDLVRLAHRRAEDEGFGPFEREFIYMIGDTVADVEAARAHGVVAVAVATGGDDADVLRATHPDHFLDSLDPPERFMTEVLP